MRLFAFMVVVLASVASHDCLLASDGQLERVARFGVAVESVDASGSRRVWFASWLDDERIIYSGETGPIRCVSIRGSKPIWTRPVGGTIESWSVSRKTGRLALVVRRSFSDRRAFVFSAADGSAVFEADEESLASLIDARWLLLNRVLMTPITGKLLVVRSSRAYGKNGYLLDPSYTKVEKRISLDPHVSEISMSDDERYLSTVMSGDVICVRDLVEQSDVLRRGERIEVEPEAYSFSIGGSFYSHVRCRNPDNMVITRDGGCWANGTVTIATHATTEPIEIASDQGHIELDVAFDHGLIAETGSSIALTVYDFEGNIIASRPRPTLQRNFVVEFSPDRNHILVGSGDTTLSVFRLTRAK